VKSREDRRKGRGQAVPRGKKDEADDLGEKIENLRQRELEQSDLTPEDTKAKNRGAMEKGRKTPKLFNQGVWADPAQCRKELN